MGIIILKMTFNKYKCKETDRGRYFYLTISFICPVVSEIELVDLFIISEYSSSNYTLIGLLKYGCDVAKLECALC